MCYRAQIGRVAFESEKQNRAINPDHCLFREDWFDNVIFTDEPWFEERQGWYCFAAVDPSVPGRDGAKAGDYCAIVIIYWKPGVKNLFVYSVVERMPNGVIASTIFDLHALHRFDSICFEDNGFQVYLADAIKKEADERKVRLPITTLTHTAPKPQRIARLGVLFENDFFKFKARNAGNIKVIKQSKMYPIGDFDDGPDALEMCHWQIQEFEEQFRRHHRKAG
jgi:predicted phage terminase large subunit-like protein